MSNTFVAVCPIKECSQQAVYKQSKNPKVYSFAGIRHGHRGFMNDNELKELVVADIIKPESKGQKVELEEDDNGTASKGQPRRDSNRGFSLGGDGEKPDSQVERAFSL